MRSQLPAVHPDFTDFLLVEGTGNDVFWMGDERWADAKPHPVQLGSFYMARYPVTQQLWLETMGEPLLLARFGDNPLHPVDGVSWYDAVVFCNALSRKEGLEEVYSFKDELLNVQIDYQKQGFRLPSEAEWEYAARGGLNGLKGCDFAGTIEEESLKHYAWYLRNGRGRTQAVGLKKPNSLGIYDLCGNVWEWCNDWYDSEYYKRKEASVTDPKGAISGTYKVRRGGSWGSEAENCRCGFRSSFEPNNRKSTYGFRLVLGATKIPKS